MSAPAIILMVCAIVILWGGLAVTTVYLLRQSTPFDASGDDGEPEPTAGLG